MRVLIVDDDKNGAQVLQQILIHHRYQADIAYDAEEALAKIQRERFDVLLIDWMMPKMSGIDLVRQLRKSVALTPIIIMLTAIKLPQAAENALQAGADDYVGKPYEPRALMQRMQEAVARRRQPVPATPKPVIKHKPAGLIPPFVGVMVATSTGGPLALRLLFEKMPPESKEKTSFFVVLHGPDWMLASLANYLQNSTVYHVKIAAHRMKIEKGCVYIAPAGKHLVLSPQRFETHLTDSEKENFVRPSADPLFRSAADTFGQYCIAVILTGMGRDGTQGASHIAAAKGTVLAQDPDTAVAPSMPTTVIQAGLAIQAPPLDGMGAVVGEEISRLYEGLSAVRRKK